MRSYNLKARAFLLTVWILGLSSTLYAFLSPMLPGEGFRPRDLALAATLAAIAGARKVKLILAPRLSEASSLSLGFLITLITLAMFGQRAGIFVGIVSALSAGLYPHRQAWHQLLFNVADVALASAGAGWTYAALQHGFPQHVSPGSALSLLLAAFVYVCINTGLVATIIGLCGNKRPERVWIENYLWTVPSYLAGASFALLLQELIDKQPLTLLLVLPVLAFIYQSYTVYTEKVEQQKRHIEELQAGRQMLSDIYLSTVRSLATAIDARDQDTHSHILRVQLYAVAVAERLGVEGDELEAVRTGALLHDVGKLGVPDYVLLKPDKLTAGEFEKMKRHAAIGASIIEQVAFPWPVASAVRHHHEHWDGSGYPDGFAGEAIPLSARILAVADVYDALISERPYRQAWPEAQARDYVRARSGSQFDPGVVNAFLDVLAEQDAAGQALVAPDRSPLERATTHQIRRNGTELWALYEVSQALNAGPDMADKLKRLGSKIATLLPGSTCLFLLYTPPAGTRQDEESAGTQDRPGNQLHVWAVEGADTTLLRDVVMLPPMNHAVRVMQARRLYAGPLAQDDPLRLCSEEIVCPIFCKSSRFEIEQTGFYRKSEAISSEDTTSMRSVLIVPLAHLGETLGALCLYHPEPNAFSADDELLTRMIAEQVQSSLYHDILFDRTRSDALTDSLTGLYNARYLAQAIEPHLHNVLESELPTTFALLYLDLDNFKSVNDCHGHEKGNEVLQRISELFQRDLRPNDLVVRYGGDEFLIFLPGVTEADARHIADRIRKSVCDCPLGLLYPNGEALSLDISIGIARFPEDGKRLNELMSVADSRMYAQKTERKFRMEATHANRENSETSLVVQAVIMESNASDAEPSEKRAGVAPDSVPDFL